MERRTVLARMIGENWMLEKASRIGVVVTTLLNAGGAEYSAEDDPAGQDVDDSEGGRC